MPTLGAYALFNYFIYLMIMLDFFQNIIAFLSFKNPNSLISKFKLFTNIFTCDFAKTNNFITKIQTLFFFVKVK